MNTASAGASASYSSEQIINQERVMALLNEDVDAFNNQELSDFVRGYCAATLDARDSWVAQLRHRRSLIHFFTTNFPSVHARELRARHRLRRLHDGFVEKLGCIRAWKKVSAALFTAAAAASAGAAAATANAGNPVAAAAASAPSVLFGALGKWTHSLLSEKESAAEKLKDVTAAMDVGSKIIIKDLGEIHAMARRMMQLQLQLQVETEAMEVDAMNTALGAKADDYSLHVSWGRARVHESILRNNCIDAIGYDRADV